MLYAWGSGDENGAETFAGDPLLRPPLGYVLVSGLAVFSVVAAASSARCLQPILLSRASACGPAAVSGAPIVAIGLGAALMVAISPRSALVVAFVGLNLLFAWTSRLLDAASPLLSLAVSRLVSLQDRAVWGGIGLNSAQLGAAATDVEGLALLVSVACLVASLERGSLAKKAAKGLAVAAGLLFVLGAEVAIFDANALSQHVTTLQALAGVAPWFTNADLLVLGSVSLGVLAVGRRAQHRL